MYFPYLRGKQFDLLALKEMAEALRDSGKIWPIIEPVRAPNGALQRCLAELSRAGVGHDLVVNPSVGDLAKSPAAPKEILDYLLATEPHDSRTTLAFLSGDETTLNLAIELANGYSRLNGADVIHNSSTPATANSAVSKIAGQVRYNVVDDKTRLRRYGAALRGASAVKIADPFPAKERNLEFVDQAESFFTDEHLYFAEDGYAGFSDYLTIGSRYAEGGSLPRVVVLHLSYAHPGDQAIYVRHFCSDTNSDTSDPAGKFGEAVAKLVSFVDALNLNNPAIDAFRKYHDDQAFPGLGMLKKLSIQNHLYVVMGALQ